MYSNDTLMRIDMQALKTEFIFYGMDQV